MPPSWQAVPAGIRNGHSEGGLIFSAATTMGCRRAHLPSASRSFPGVFLHRFASLGLKSRIDARWRVFSRVFLQRFSSLGLKSRIDAHLWAFPGKTLHRFPSLALKSRITARRRANLGQSLQRFPSLTPEIKNHCTLEDVSGQKPAVIPKFTP